jgi:23S rRNA pseudouridine1911/1915/1917 synthase
MIEPLTFVASAQYPRDRLDKLVVAALESAGQSASRAAVQRWIDHGRVTDDGKALRASSAVPLGACVEVRPEPAEATSAAPDASIALTIVYEDAFLVIVDKPAGLVVHPARGHAGGTLVNGLLARGGFERASADSRDPEGHVRPGIVHRLDKGTSGLLVVAKDEPTREGLKAQFSSHTIEREYVAIACGPGREATYSTLHERHPTDRFRFTSLGMRGRRAVTHVSVLEPLGPATLLSCRLETGRTHQIRVHLTEQARTPILADPLYGKTPRDPSLRAIGEALGRQALHARLLGFVHPATGEAMRWESALPADMAKALAALRALTKSSI